MTHLRYSSTNEKPGGAIMKRDHPSFFGISRVFRCSLEGEEPTTNQS